MSFETHITRDGDTLSGPLRAPAQMLAEQEYAGHTSVHDDDTAAKLGLPGAPIEGPTHFSQIDPLAVERWGQAWFERGCVSSHFLNMVVEGEEVRAALIPVTATMARITAEKSDGTPVLAGTASFARNSSSATAAMAFADCCTAMRPNSWLNRSMRWCVSSSGSGWRTPGSNSVTESRRCGFPPKSNNVDSTCMKWVPKRIQSTSARRPLRIPRRPPQRNPELSKSK